MLRNWTICTLLLGCVPAVSAAEPSPAAAVEFFEKTIRPQLVAHCYGCHSADSGKQKGSLSLDTRDGWQRGGESGPAIVPGKPEDSLLLQALQHRADVSAMPPSEKLPAEVIANFERWIRDGAVDPRDGPAASIRRGMSLEEGRRFWSFRAPQMPEIPTTRSDWPRTPIDQFILSRQSAEELKPISDAEPAILFRRLAFDLTGLPPDPEQSKDFVARWTAAAAEQDLLAQDAVLAEAADRMLASTHFGERWGRHWLDIVRYADSNGRDRNVYFHHAWRYRDYVIQSLNDDKPYDQFVREQIAGDLLPSHTPEQRDEQRIATGLLALGAKAFEEQNPEIFRMDVIDDQIEVVGRAFLGLSIGCARCHDHKFDPIPTADYYALAGIFRSTQPLYGYGPKGIRSNIHTHTELIPVGSDAERLRETGLEYLRTLQALTLEQNESRSKRYRVVRNLNDAKLKLKELEADTAALEADIARMEAEIAAWDEIVKAAEMALQQAMDSAPPQPGWAMGVRDREAPEDCRIHLRGETTTLGDAVPRGMLQVIALSEAIPASTTQSGRLELAAWLTRRDHPLTARVYVNRIWQHLLGRGLVATPDDFGVSGAPPSHPELLDYLAVRFMDEGWSTKRLIRAIVTSRVYRMTAAVNDRNAELVASQFKKDPDNEFLWRRVPRRLEAEALHDAVLFVAGNLDLRPPHSEQQFLAQFNPYREDEYRTFKPLFVPADLQHRHRAVYLPVIRGVLPEIFQLFDFASPERPVSQRDESIVPAQSLYFLNSPWIARQAEQCAERLLSLSDCDDAGRVDRLFQLAFGRAPQKSEQERALRYLSAALPAVAAQPIKPSPPPANDRNLAELTNIDAQRQRIESWTNLCQAVFASAEFRYVK